jgi:hypothetical protein
MEQQMRIIHAALTLVLAACAAPGPSRQQLFVARMDAWVGQHADDLARSLGPPTSAYTLSNGGRVLQYAKTETTTSGGGSYTVNTPVQTPSGMVNVPQQRTRPVVTATTHCTLLFSVSPAHVIESWKADGNACY